MYPENPAVGHEKSMEVPSKFKRVCVFCGSSTGKRQSYREAAIELGQELVMYTSTCIAFSQFHLKFPFSELGLCCFCSRLPKDWILCMEVGVLGSWVWFPKRFTMVVAMSLGT